MLTFTTELAWLFVLELNKRCNFIVIPLLPLQKAQWYNHHNYGNVVSPPLLSHH